MLNLNPQLNIRLFKDITQTLKIKNHAQLYYLCENIPFSYVNSVQANQIIGFKRLNMSHFNLNLFKSLTLQVLTL